MFHATRTGSTLGNVDNVTLRVSYDHPLPGHTTVVAVSQCGVPPRAFDWGQNKRNLAQVRVHACRRVCVPVCLCACVRIVCVPACVCASLVCECECECVHVCRRVCVPLCMCLRAVCVTAARGRRVVPDDLCVCMCVPVCVPVCVGGGGGGGTQLKAMIEDELVSTKAHPLAATVSDADAHTLAESLMNPAAHD
jgi:hypothetical protein